MSLTTPLTGLLGIDHPLLLAPMGGGSGGKLAAAVTEAGGLGLIGGGYGDADWVEAQFGEAGNSRVGVGFITWKLGDDSRALDTALAHGPAAVMLSFGDPSPYAGAIKSAGAKLICQVQSVSGACTAAEAGADVIVAQGTEAGGHGADRATFPLVPAVVDAVAPLPVVAAGGITDGRGVAAALVLGAAGVLMGTRFMATPEYLGHDRQKARLVEGTADATLRTTVFDIARGLDWPAAYTGRALRNDFTDDWHGNEAALGAVAEAERTRYAAAAAEGDFDTAVVFCGEGIDLIHDIVPARELVTRLMAETSLVLDHAKALTA